MRGTASGPNGFGTAVALGAIVRVGAAVCDRVTVIVAHCCGDAPAQTVGDAVIGGHAVPHALVAVAVAVAVSVAVLVMVADGNAVRVARVTDAVAVAVAVAVTVGETLAVLVIVPVVVRVAVCDILRVGKRNTVSVGKIGASVRIGRLVGTGVLSA